MIYSQISLFDAAFINLRIGKLQREKLCYWLGGTNFFKSTKNVKRISFFSPFLYLKLFFRKFLYELKKMNNIKYFFGQFNFIPGLTNHYITIVERK